MAQLPVPTPVDDGNRALFCPKCSYDLRGLAAGTCPECGEPFDPAVLQRPQLPWPYRHQIGWLRAYWYTVWLVMAWGRQCCQEIDRPVSYRDARLFQAVTIAITLVSIAAAVSAMHLAHPMEVITHFPWIVPVAVAMITIFLFAITGIHTYWFHPRSLPTKRQNRSIALAYYCCAPLAWTPVVAAIWIIAITASTFLDAGGKSITAAAILKRINQRKRVGCGTSDSSIMREGVGGEVDMVE